MTQVQLQQFMLLDFMRVRSTTAQASRRSAKGQKRSHVMGLEQIEDIANNAVENPFFADDTHLPHSEYLVNPSDWYNGVQEGTETGCKTPVNWRLMSPMYSYPPPTSYKTIRGIKFLHPTITGNPTLPTVVAPPELHQLDSDYEDYNPPVNQKRIVKLYGFGQTFIDNYDPLPTAYNYNRVNRRAFDVDDYEDQPMMCVSGHLGDTVPDFPSAKAWVKYEVWSDKIDVPADAITCKFGVFIRCPYDDLFRDDNFGGIYAQEHRRVTNHNDEVITHFIAVHKRGNQPELKDGTIITSSDRIQDNATGEFIREAQFQWGGLACDETAGSTAGEEWKRNSFVIRNSIPTGKYEEAENFRRFGKVERTFTLEDHATYRKLCIGLYFCENQTNLDNSGIKTGSIDFYQPFVQFFDSNGDVL